MNIIDVKIQETEEFLSILKSHLAKCENDLYIWKSIKRNYSGSFKDTLNYPTYSTAEQQVIHILTNILRRASKMKEIENVYEEYHKENPENTVQIHQVVRRLKTEGLITAIRYNRQNKTTFWGLSEWVENKDFKNDYKPKRQSMPVRIFDKEVL